MNPKWGINIWNALKRSAKVVRNLTNFFAVVVVFVVRVVVNLFHSFYFIIINTIVNCFIKRRGIRAKNALLCSLDSRHN